MFLLLFAFSSISLAAGNDCPSYQPSVSCSSSVLIVLDFTNKVMDGQRADEISSLKDQILPHIASNNGQKVGITYTGGNGYPMPSSLTSSYDELCAQFDAISKVATPRNQANLLELFESIYAKFGNTIDHLLLYTGDDNTNDVEFAGDYAHQFMPNMKISVVSFSGWRALWEGFPYMGIVYVSPYKIYNQTVADCLVGQTCGSIDKCTALPNFDAAPPPSPPPPTPNPIVLEQACSSCIPQNVSADVIILIENSGFTGLSGLQKIESYIKTTFSQFNVQTSGSTDPFHMRVGIRYYSDITYDYKTFGTVTASDLANIKIHLNNANETDMSDALWDAERDFTQATPKRPNAPQVIVVFATDFYGGAFYRFPVPDFHDFVAKGGKVIVFELDKPGMNGYVLKQLTNPVYYINSTDPNTENAMIRAMCTASCVCPKDTRPYFADPNSAQPIAGCYLPTAVVSSYSAASSQCARRGGYIAEAQTAQKSDFLTSLSTSFTMYQGLKWDATSSSWMWANGKALGSDYAPWAGSSAHATNQDCVTIAGGKWRQTDCRNGYNYVCQLPPCDQRQAC